MWHVLGTVYIQRWEREEACGSDCPGNDERCQVTVDSELVDSGHDVMENPEFPSLDSAEVLLSPKRGMSHQKKKEA